jgi:hypothetical protein
MIKNDIYLFIKIFVLFLNNQNCYIKYNESLIKQPKDYDKIKHIRGFSKG